MSRARRPSPDVQWYAHDLKRKRPIAGSTVATSHLLGALAEANPDADIARIRSLVNFDNDALDVCDAYIAIGESNVIPRWRY